MSENPKGLGVLDTVYSAYSQFGALYSEQIENKAVFDEKLFSAFGAGPINIDLYYGASGITGGTTHTPFNRNLRSSSAAEIVVKSGVSVSDTGTLTELQWQIQSKSGGHPIIASTGGEAKEGTIFIPGIDIYLFKLTNTEAEACDGATFSFDWVET